MSDIPTQAISDVNPLIAQFLNWEQASRDTIDFKKAYVDMADDLVAGLVLSQIVYWHLPGRNGVTRLRISQDGHQWIAKKRQEWWEEIRITPKQLDLALKKLEAKGLIHTALYHFNRKPTKHVRLNWDGFLQAFQLSILPKGENSPILPKGKNKKRPILPKGKNAISPKGKILITENTDQRIPDSENTSPQPAKAVAAIASPTTSPVDDNVKATEPIYPVSQNGSEPQSEALKSPLPKVALKGIPDAWYVLRETTAFGPQKSFEQCKRIVAAGGGVVTQGQGIGPNVERILTPLPEPPQPHVRIIEAYHNALPETYRPIGKPQYGRNGEAAMELLKAGITPEQVSAYVKENYPSYLEWARKDPKHPPVMSLDHVKVNIRAWLNKDKPIEGKPSSAAHQPAVSKFDKVMAKDTEWNAWLAGAAQRRKDKA